jgi:ferric-dicitrate binding protein FerR (iron transport regulator)
MKSQGKLEFIAVLLVVFASVSVAVGQYRGSPNSPPKRAVRVQYISGEVSVAPSGTSDWAAASMNQVLTPAADVWTDKNSRAELNVGGGFIRMNSETSVTVSNVDPNTVQFKVNQGAVSLSVGRLFGGEIYEIDTPNATLTIMKSGVYRVDVHPNEDQTWVTVRRGSLTATGQGNAVKVNSGEHVRFRSETSLQHTAEKAPAIDGFDDWANVRDQRLGVFRPVPFGVGIGYWPYGPVGPGWGPYRR